MKVQFKNLKIPLIVVALCLIVAGGLASASVRYFNSDKRDQPLVFSKNSMIYELWEDYKDKFVEERTFRAIDRSQADITTSEGMSYSMLRAVWMDDRNTFDRSWQWTKDNLQREEDRLMSWKFGERSDGSFGILTEVGGANTASDADVDIALSLLMAYSRWNESDYIGDARPIINSIWEKEVFNAGGKPVLAANDLEKLSDSDLAVVNPSYFAPYAFKLFAEVDDNEQHNWIALADNSYDVISRSLTSPLDKTVSANIVPDWISVSKRTGEISPPQPGNTTTNYSYDALRTSWRLALDWQWNKDARAKRVLQQMDFLGQQWDTNGKLISNYGHDGSVIEDYESPAMYGGSIGYFNVNQPKTAQTIYNDKLSRVYDPDNQAGIEGLNYYDANWAWFGIALQQNALPNLTEVEQL